MKHKSGILLFFLFLLGVGLRPTLSAADLLFETNAKLTRLSLTAAIDGQAIFTEKFCENIQTEGVGLGYEKDCDDYFHRPESVPIQPAKTGNAARHLRVLFVPGIFGECFPSLGLFANTRKFLENNKHRGVQSITTEVLKVSGYSSSTANAELLSRAVLDLKLKQSERLVVVAYSKGAADVLEMLVRYPQAAKKIDAVLSVAGSVLGSPLAEDKDIFNILFKHTRSHCRGPDGAGVNSLRANVREIFLQQNKLPPNIKYYSIAGVASKKQTSRILRPMWKQAAKVSPFSDSQLIFSDAVIPGSYFLGYMKADHWAIAMPFVTDSPVLSQTLVNKNKFPREIMMSTAIEIISSRMKN